MELSWRLLSVCLPIWTFPLLHLLPASGLLSPMCLFPGMLIC
jgi:hypothetical protein